VVIGKDSSFGRTIAPGVDAPIEIGARGATSSRATNARDETAKDDVLKIRANELLKTGKYSSSQ